MRNRPPIPSDNIGKPCNCLACQGAGVTHLPIVRVPADEHIAQPHWLHGEPLRRWHDARDRFRALAREAVGPRGRHADGFEPLARKASA